MLERLLTHSPRRRRALLWTTPLSLALHLAIVTLLLALVPWRTIVVPSGGPQALSEMTTITVERKPPVPVRQRQRVIKPTIVAPPRHELARESPIAPPQPPQTRPQQTPSLQRDQETFAREVAELNKSNDPHAIPTIDPAQRVPSMKSFAFDAAASGYNQGHGNGYIIPTKKWIADGQNCYYARYQYTYPDGAEEDGNIAWPFCFVPAEDPFKLPPPHMMPFPDPPAGFRIADAATLPPLERAFYEDWIAGH